MVPCTAPLLGSGQWKLIRDLLPEAFARDGEVYTLATATPEQMKNLLVWKLTEEISEFRDTPVVEEMADVHEVLLTIQAVWGFEPIILEAIRTLLPTQTEVQSALFPPTLDALLKFARAPSHDHLAAVQVHVNALARSYGLDPLAIEQARLNKVAVKGSFSRGYVMQLPPL